MATNAGHYKDKISLKDRSKVSGEVSGQEKRYAEKIWKAISKYVAFDDEAMFKDPNWPYLWDKKK